MKLGKKLRFLCLLCAFAVLPYHNTSAFSVRENLSWWSAATVALADSSQNLWQKWIINPVSKIWEPFFTPDQILLLPASIDQSKQGVDSESEVPTITLSESISNTNTKEQIFDYIQEFLNLSLTQKTSNESEPQTPIINNFNTYVTTGSRGSSSQGLADTVGKSTANLQSSIDTINSNSVFNTSALSVDTANTRVGIGTTSPSDTLSINGPIYLSQISTPANTSNRLYNTGGDLYWAGSVIGGATTGQWTTDGTHVWRAGGNVGIATTSPYRKLSVSGDAVFTGGDVLASTFTATSSITTPSLTLSSVAVNSLISTNSSGMIIATSTPTFGYFNATSTSATSTISGGLAIANSGFVYDYSTGNIGIGTASPGSRLVVKGVGATSASSALNVTNSADTSLLYVRNDGNVGIGTTGPGTKLSVVGSESGGTAISIQNTSAIEYEGLDFYNELNTRVFSVAHSNTSAAVNPASSWIGTRVAEKLHFVTNGTTPRVTIDTTGNVGIGTTSPQMNLHVYSASNGMGMTVDTATGNDVWYYVRQGNASKGAFGYRNSTGNLALWNGISDILNINTSSGNVGIGTTSPKGTLHVYDSGGSAEMYLDAPAAYNSNLLFSKDGTPKWQLYVPANSNDLRLYDSGDKVTFQAGGNVGIGTTTPANQLQVGTLAGLDGNLGGMMLSENLYYSSGWKLKTAAPGYIIGGNGSTDGSFHVYTAPTGVAGSGVSITDRLTVLNTGNVGIGTTNPGQKLSVSGSVGLPALANDSTGYYVCLNTTTGVLATSTTACGASSLKFKENILDLGYGLEEILKLRPVSFDYKEEYVKNGKRQIGFVAEEVEPLIPEVVAKDERGEIQGLDYPKFVSVLVKAMQELNTKVDALRDELKNGLTAVKNLVLDSLTAEIVYTRELNAEQINVKNINIDGDICVNSTCITKDLFEQMILRSGVGAVQMSSSAVPPPAPDSAKAPPGEEGGGENDTTTSTEDAASSTPEITEETTLSVPSPDQGEGQGGALEAENPTTELDPSQNTMPE